MGERHGGSPLPPGEKYPMPEAELEARAWALESLLAEKGLLSSDLIEKIVRAYENDIGPMMGARVVARAWVDPAFKQRLLENATAAAAEMGIAGMQGEHMVCVANTPQVHNVMCCTLCSCYPWEMLGLPPVWYKSAPYRSRAVKDPRGVLGDFGVTLADDTEIRVWDSTAETRFLVIPMRPAGTDGWSEDQLADLVTRDSMIGTGLAIAPSEPKR